MAAKVNTNANDQYSASDFFSYSSGDTLESEVLPIDYFGKLIPDFYAFDTVERRLIEYGTDTEYENSVAGFVMSSYTVTSLSGSEDYQNDPFLLVTTDDSSSISFNTKIKRGVIRIWYSGAEPTITITEVGVSNSKNLITKNFSINEFKYALFSINSNTDNSLKVSISNPSSGSLSCVVVGF